MFVTSDLRASQQCWLNGPVTHFLNFVEFVRDCARMELAIMVGYISKIISHYYFKLLLIEYIIIIW